MILIFYSDINRNVYDGKDYLPGIYNQWMKDTNRFNFVLTSDVNDKIVGFASLSYYQLAEKTVFVCQAARLHADVQGRNLLAIVARWFSSFIKRQADHPIFLGVRELNSNELNSVEYKTKLNRILSGAKNQTILYSGLSFALNLDPDVISFLEIEAISCCGYPLGFDKQSKKVY